MPVKLTLSGPHTRTAGHGEVDHYYTLTNGTMDLHISLTNSPDLNVLRRTAKTLMDVMNQPTFDAMLGDAALRTCAEEIEQIMREAEE